MRSPIAKVTAAMSCSEAKAPETRARSSPRQYAARRRDDDVLRLQGRDQSARVEPQTGEPLDREVDVNHLILGAKNIDPGNILDLQELRADVSTWSRNSRCVKPSR